MNAEAEASSSTQEVPVVVPPADVVDITEEAALTNDSTPTLPAQSEEMMLRPKSLFSYPHPIVTLKLHGADFQVHHGVLTKYSAYFLGQNTTAEPTKIEIPWPEISQESLGSYIDLLYRQYLTDGLMLGSKLTPDDLQLPLLCALARVYKLCDLAEDLTSGSWVATRMKATMDSLTLEWDTEDKQIETIKHLEAAFVEWSSTGENDCPKRIVGKLCKTCPREVFTRHAPSMSHNFLVAVSISYATLAEEERENGEALKHVINTSRVPFGTGYKTSPQSTFSFGK